MNRALSAAFLATAMTGCANMPSGNIDFEAASARLYVAGADGKPIAPFAGELVDVDGIGLGREAIRLLPGNHLIRRQCPNLPEGVASSHQVSYIEHRFEAGKRYLLLCNDDTGLSIVPYPH